LLASVAALTLAIVLPAPAKPAASGFLGLVLMSTRNLSDSQFASLVHWARAGAASPKFSDPAYRVEFDILRTLDEPDRHAMLVFLRGGGRSALYARGATDADIGSRRPVNVGPATPAPTPTPNPYRSLEFGSPTIGGAPVGNVVVFGGWAAVKRDGRGAHACISFKNADSRTATRVLFQFPISDDAGAALAQLELDRRGTFSPGIDIHGWGSLASWQGGTGNRAYSENCTGVSTGVAALPLLAARFVTYRILRVEYADGTSWTPPTTPSP
jgi:hypothetical protein